MTSCTVIPSPVVSWSGSRLSLAESIRARFPPDFDTYYEPMLGGACVFLGMHSYPSTIADKNRWLMDTYWALREDYRRVGMILESLVPTRETYNRVRRIYPSCLDLHSGPHI